MRFRGGGVGHKATRAATDRFKRDRHKLDLEQRKDNQMRLDMGHMAEEQASGGAEEVVLEPEESEDDEDSNESGSDSEGENEPEEGLGDQEGDDDDDGEDGEDVMTLAYC